MRPVNVPVSLVPIFVPCTHQPTRCDQERFPPILDDLHQPCTRITPKQNGRHVAPMTHPLTARLWKHSHSIDPTICCFDIHILGSGRAILVCTVAVLWHRLYDERHLHELFRRMKKLGQTHFVTAFCVVIHAYCFSPWDTYGVTLVPPLLHFAERIPCSSTVACINVLQHQIEQSQSSSSSTWSEMLSPSQSGHSSWPEEETASSSAVLSCPRFSGKGHGPNRSSRSGPVKTSCVS